MKAKELQPEIEETLVNGAETMLRVLMMEGIDFISGETLHRFCRERAAALAQQLAHRTVKEDEADAVALLALRENDDTTTYQEVFSDGPNDYERQEMHAAEMKLK